MKHLTACTDAELLLILQEKSHSRAFEVIYKRYFPAVFRYVFKIAQDKQTAEDLVQNIFVGLWRNPRKSSIENLQAYLFGAARNQLAKHFRALKFSPLQLKFIEKWEATNATEEYLEELDTRRMLEEAINQLPNKCKSVFMLSRYGFLSNKEIAAKLGISVFTVENHIKKALCFLRQSLQMAVMIGMLQ
ncbi:RNA polymerase sigma-70 factor [Cyclobacterium xiamenense]|uniref:RNA polymerase sigma-70 factor n=1 Tax=Cyclobacterium xiamenense TaxID=1297121 RepID=UPI0035D12AD7